MATMYNLAEYCTRQDYKTMLEAKQEYDNA